MCPLNQTYYPLTGWCSCPPAFPIFDNVTRLCMEPPCPSGKLWDRYLLKCGVATKNCSLWQYFNFSSQLCQDMCPVNVPYYSRTDTCFCPVSAPLFDLATRQCLVPNCSSGYSYNPYLIKCSPTAGNCSAWQVFNFTNETCLTMCPVNHTYFPGNNTCNCTPAYPLWNATNGNCTGLPCAAKDAWNPYFFSCTPLLLPCLRWQLFNFTLQACENKCPVNHTYYANNDTCECFPQAPMWDPVNLTCVVPNCTNGTKWDPVVNRCVPLKGNCSAWQFYNWTADACIDMCPIGQTYFPLSGRCQCPPEFPLWSNSTGLCLIPACPSGLMYNQFLMKCSPLHGVCPLWAYYDFTMQVCIVRCPINHFYYSNNDSCQCPPSSPYFNSTTRQCQIPHCHNITGWNTHFDRCISLNGQCYPWQLYNFTDATCLAMCSPGQTYFISNDSCSCYPAAPIFDYASRTCQPPQCLYGQVWSVHFYRCQCPVASTFNQSNLICQPVCLEGYFLNYTANLCEPICGANMYVNGSNQCQCIPNFVLAANGVGCRQKCPYGFQYSNQDLECQPICGPNMYVNYNNQCQCLPGYVINLNGFGCRQRCPQGFRYNRSALVCSPVCNSNMEVNASNLCQCLPGYTYNSNGIGCRPRCPLGYQYNYTQLACSPICAQGMMVNSNNQCECLPGHIFNVNGVGCRSHCPPGYQYNYSTLVCSPICGVNMIVDFNNNCRCQPGYVPSNVGYGCKLQCPPGFLFNTTLFLCQPVCGANQHVNSSNLCMCDRGYMPSPQGCVPVQCPGNYLFNYRSQRCEPVCAQGMYVDSNNNCQCLPGHIQNVNGVGCRSHCPVGYQYNYSTLTCSPICGANMYVNSNNQCACIVGYVFSASGLSCNALCPGGYTFNISTGACQPICGVRMHINSSNLCTCDHGYMPSTLRKNCVPILCITNYIYNYATQRCEPQCFSN
jgi:hypothetical protein